jgi:hypothetical protein
MIRRDRRFAADDRQTYRKRKMGMAWRGQPCGCSWLAKVVSASRLGSARVVAEMSLSRGNYPFGKRKPAKHRNGRAERVLPRNDETHALSISIVRQRPWVICRATINWSLVRRPIVATFRPVELFVVERLPSYHSHRCLCSRSSAGKSRYVHAADFRLLLKRPLPTANGSLTSRMSGQRKVASMSLRSSISSPGVWWAGR